MSIDWKTRSRFAGPTDSPGFLLWQITHLWQRRINDALATLDLTQMQFVLIAGTGWLAAQGETVTQQRLSDFCKIERMQVSQVVRLLEKKGFVKRRDDRDDRRAKNLSLTAKGRRALEAALPAVEDVDAALFGPAHRPAELTRLLEVLR